MGRPKSPGSTGLTQGDTHSPARLWAAGRGHHGGGALSTSRASLQCFSLASAVSSRVIIGAVCVILSFLLATLKKVKETGEFSAGLMVRIPGFHYHGLASVPCRGTEILQAMWCGHKNPKIKNKEQV